MHGSHARPAFPASAQLEAEQRLTVAAERLHQAIKALNAEPEEEGGKKGERLETALALYWSSDPIEQINYEPPALVQAV